MKKNSPPLHPLALEVSPEGAGSVGGADRLEPVAGRPPIAWKVVDGAEGDLPGKGEMSTPLAGGLSYHRLRVAGVEGSVGAYRPGVYYKYIKIYAAEAAP